MSMDFTSFYINIPHQDDIQAFEEVWEKRTVKEPPKHILMKLLALVLKCNNFECNGKHCLQIQGMAIGKKMESCANIFIGRLEKQHLQSDSFKTFKWLRSIDDVDMMWIHGKDTGKRYK